MGRSSFRMWILAINPKRTSLYRFAAQRTLVANIRSFFWLMMAGGTTTFVEHCAALFAQAQVVAVRNAVLLRVGEADDTCVGDF